MLMDIGIQKKERKLITGGLSRFLADTFILCLKTQNYHWNVTGSSFKALHTLFEELYVDLFSAGDMIAERIRALDFYVPGSYSEFSHLTAIEEERAVPEAADMIHQLTLDNELMIRRASEVCSMAESLNDPVTVDLMVQRMKAHSHSAWLLRSHIEVN